MDSWYIFRVCGFEKFRILKPTLTLCPSSFFSLCPSRPSILYNTYYMSAICVYPQCSESEKCWVKVFLRLPLNDPQKTKLSVIAAKMEINTVWKAESSVSVKPISFEDDYYSRCRCWGVQSPVQQLTRGYVRTNECTVRGIHLSDKPMYSEMEAEDLVARKLQAIITLDYISCVSSVR